MVDCFLSVGSANRNDGLGFHDADQVYFCRILVHFVARIAFFIPAAKAMM